jgi:drug/metabolite transporter (DMT)-like permease
MKLRKETQGEFFILAQAALWGLFPVITILSYNTISPLISLEISTIFGAFFFAVVLTIKKKWHEVKDTAVLKDILLAAFFLGIVYYLLYFFGLQYTTAGNASIVALTEVFFSYLFFHIWKKDQVPLPHIIGSALMILGAVIVLYPNMHRFQIGDILILGAASVAPFGNYFARKVRAQVSSESLMFIRSLISAFVIFLLVMIFHPHISKNDIQNAFLFLFINGVFLLGLSKLFWVEGIHRISVVKANALSSLSPLLTLIFAWIVLKNSPTIWQLLSFIPMFFGILLLGIKKEKTIKSK